jgi:hypothetical protein
MVTLSAATPSWVPAITFSIVHVLLPRRELSRLARVTLTCCIFRYDGTLLKAMASYNVGPELRAFVDRNPIAPGRHSISARAALERRMVHVPDVQILSMLMLPVT